MGQKWHKIAFNDQFKFKTTNLLTKHMIFSISLIIICFCFAKHKRFEAGKLWWPLEKTSTREVLGIYFSSTTKLFVFLDAQNSFYFSMHKYYKLQILKYWLVIWHYFKWEKKADFQPEFYICCLGFGIRKYQSLLRKSTLKFIWQLQIVKFNSI